MTLRSKFRLAPVLFAALLLSMAVFGGAFSSSAICPECGLIRDTTEWQVLFVRDAALSTTRSYRTTAVGEALKECGLQKAHVHRWMFAQGAGNGISCALGKGRYILRMDQSQEVAALIKMAHHHGENALVRDTRTVLTDPERCDVVGSLASEVDMEHVNEVQHFHRWLEKHEEEVKAIREAATTPP